MKLFSKLLGIAFGLAVLNFCIPRKQKRHQHNNGTFIGEFDSLRHLRQHQKRILEQYCSVPATLREIPGINMEADDKICKYFDQQIKAYGYECISDEE